MRRKFLLHRHDEHIACIPRATEEEETMNTLKLMAAMLAIPAGLVSSQVCAAVLAAPVFVANPNDDPVPVTITGNSAGTSNVNVTNTPSVNVTNSQLTVRDADNPARQAFYAAGQPCSANNVLATVPAGKVLVIETISASITDFPVGNFPNVQLQIGIPNQPQQPQNIYHILVPLQGNDSVGSTYVVTQAVRFYGAPNSQVSLSVIPDRGGVCSAAAEISGYLVNTP